MQFASLYSGSIYGLVTSSGHNKENNWSNQDSDIFETVPKTAKSSSEVHVIVKT